MPENAKPDERRLLIVIATYNERESLPELVELLLEQLPFSQLLVIDDNSPDGTGEWCRQAAADDERISVTHRSGKLGLGSATILGLKHAQEYSFQWVATLDADLSHDPATLRTMWDSYCDNAPADKSGHAGVVIGSRYVPGGKIVGWPWYRRLSSFLVNWFSQLALGLPSKDNTSAFRIYQVESLHEIDLSSIKSKGYSYLEEILLLLSQHGIKFVEHPIIFRDRELGHSKVDIRELVRSLGQILRLARESRIAGRKTAAGIALLLGTFT